MLENHKMQEKTLNCIKKTESWSPFKHYNICASVKCGLQTRQPQTEPWDLFASFFQVFVMFHVKICTKMK